MTKWRDDPARTPPSRRAAVLLGAALVLVWVAETLAKASLPLLLRDAPVVLIMLEAKASDLLLAGPKVSAAEFIVVGTASRFVVHTLYYLAGRWYGEAALRWVSRRSRLANRLSDRSGLAFRRFAVPAVFLTSNKPICVLAGASGMRPSWFVALHLIGTAIRITALRFVAHSNHGLLSRVDGYIDRNAVWLTVVFAIVTAIAVMVTAVLHRRGHSDVDRSDGA